MQSQFCSLANSGRLLTEDPARTQSRSFRILGVGTIQIYTAGDEPEFTIVDMPDPHVIQAEQEMRSDKA